MPASLRRGRSTCPRESRCEMSSFPLRTRCSVSMWLSTPIRLAWMRRARSAASCAGTAAGPRATRPIAPDWPAAVARLEAILDRYALFEVEINPESRVKVAQGAARPELVEQGARLFLVKVVNQAGVTASLAVESPNAGRVYVTATGAPDPETRLTEADTRDRWAELSLYDKPPLTTRLSGLGLEYRILEVYSRDRGQRSARVAFNVGQGTQDIGLRNDVLVLFNAVPAPP